LQSKGDGYMEELIRLGIMGVFTGYLGNILYGKNKSKYKCVKVGCIVGSVVIVIHTILINL